MEIKTTWGQMDLIYKDMIKKYGSDNISSSELNETIEENNVKWVRVDDLLILIDSLIESIGEDDEMFISEQDHKIDMLKQIKQELI